MFGWNRRNSRAKHYLGALAKIGETVWYVAIWREQWVAQLSLSAAALKCGVGAGHVAEGADVDDVGVLGVNAGAGDLAGIGETEVGPSAAGVDELVDAIAMGSVAADGLFAHAGVDDIGIGLGDGERADGAGFEEGVGDGGPGGASVGGFPNAAAGRAEIVCVGLGGAAGDEGQIEGRSRHPR